MSLCAVADKRAVSPQPSVRMPAAASWLFLFARWWHICPQGQGERAPRPQADGLGVSAIDGEIARVRQAHPNKELEWSARQPKERLGVEEGG
ncbi:hypothetical protein CSOJ01_06580 [Colletotrichum sojae]|uniref:Uncharacterized protein n=1 Tax=Colletotrichum sojae TaxID=2175907 RepID=A0A8H6JBB0_9PEZI|nr:hypothetical protein CSOJ01_06580 [Colletotrichum sojae]